MENDQVIDEKEHSDWKIILADEDSRQVVLYNSVLEELQVRPPTTVTLNSSLKCSLCNRPFLSESAYFTFLRSHHQATSTPLLANTATNTNSDAEGIPKSSFDEGYYARFFREIKKLGRGAGGSVYHCQHVLNSTPLGSYAVKKIPVGDDPKWLSKMLREAQVLSEISKHPNVIDYKHCWLETWQPTPFGPPIPTLHLLMELVDGPNLEDALSRGLLPPDSVPFIFEEILRSIRHLHSLDILHRDLKPGNILLRAGNESEYTAVVTDFGECQRSTEHMTRSGNTGTIEYSAPEVIRGERYTKATDIWSLGIILYQLTTHSMPWKSLDVDFLRDKLINLDEFIIQKDKDIPKWAASLLNEMLQVDPKKRLTADQIIIRLKEIRKKPSAQQSDRFLIITTAVTISMLFAVCYPCSINLLLLFSLFALYPMRLSRNFHILTTILVILYFMTFNQPCTSCRQ